MLQYYLSSYVTSDPDGVYVARFPCQLNPPSLPRNFTIAECRILQMLKRLAKTPNVLQIYSKVIDEQDTRGFIEHVKLIDVQSNVHYIPYHSVEKDSPTTPVHIAFDCSYQQSPGHPYACLNDCLLIGSLCVSDLLCYSCPFQVSLF